MSRSHCHQLSEALFELRRIFLERRRSGRSFEDNEIIALERVCRILAEHASAMENEFERMRFAGIARQEPDIDALLSEARRPGSNVALFRMIPRPHYGGAA